MFNDGCLFHAGSGHRVNAPSERPSLVLAVAVMCWRLLEVLCSIWMSEGWLGCFAERAMEGKRITLERFMESRGPCDVYMCLGRHLSMWFTQSCLCSSYSWMLNCLYISWAHFSFQPVQNLTSCSSTNPFSWSEPPGCGPFTRGCWSNACRYVIIDCALFGWDIIGRRQC